MGICETTPKEKKEKRQPSKKIQVDKDVVIEIESPS
jgi:hypothetical protein